MKLIPVEKFAKDKGYQIQDVIELLENGFYLGKKVRGEWLIYEDADKEHPNTKINPERSARGRNYVHRSTEMEENNPHTSGNRATIGDGIRIGLGIVIVLVILIIVISFFGGVVVKYHY